MGRTPHAGSLTAGGCCRLLPDTVHLANRDLRHQRGPQTAHAGTVPAGRPDPPPDEVLRNVRYPL